MPLNKVMLIGRLGQKPELKYTEGGTAYAKLSLATSETWKDKSGDKQSKTTWHNLTAWGKTAETMTRYLDKGQEVFVEGKIDNSKSEKDGVMRYYTTIVVSNFTFVGSKDNNGGNNTNDNTNDNAPPQENEKPISTPTDDDNDDLPF